MEHERFPEESQPHFDSDLVRIFEATNKMIEQKPHDKNFIGRELRERAINHGLDPIEFGQQFWKWKSKK